MHVRIYRTYNYDVAVVYSNLGNLWTQHDLYKKVLSHNVPIPLPENTRDEVLHSITVLLVSTNEAETLAIRSYLRSLDGHEAIYQFNQDGKPVVYYIGKYGACPAAVTNVPHGFEVHISTLANQCFPNLCAIVSVGVACGIEGKVEICDVLVSSQVVNYDDVPLDDQIPRDKPFSVSQWLKKLFSQPAHWPDYTIRKRLINNKIPMPNVISGVILSGPANHFDDPAVNSIIGNLSSEAIGIEMQRAYHFTKDTVNAIIVKAVYNFRDGMDNEEYQPTAALLAADLVHLCLSDRQASEKLKGLDNVAICLLKLRS